MEIDRLQKGKGKNQKGKGGKDSKGKGKSEDDKRKGKNKSGKSGGGKGKGGKDKTGKDKEGSQTLPKTQTVLSSGQPITSPSTTTSSATSGGGDRVQSLCHFDQLSETILLSQCRTVHSFPLLSQCGCVLRALIMLTQVTTDPNLRPAQSEYGQSLSPPGYCCEM